MKKISAIWLVIVLFTCCVIFCSTVVIANFVVRPFKGEKAGHDAGHRIAIYWAKTIIFLIPGWHARVSGIENIPVGKKFVMVANHESITDIFVILLLGIQFRYLSKSSMFKVPIMGQAMKAAGYIGVDRGNRRSQVVALKECRRVLNEGTPMLFFAEGTRSPTGEILPFKVGAFKLAQDTDSMILPICLKGTRDLLVKGSITPGKSEVKVMILEPFPRLPGEDLDNWAARTRDCIINAKASSPL
ncbi:MAG: lysophospholipid acyltransferase family protein [Pseudomonadota bacterium]